ncbi:MAG TPA: ferritin-like domain-containing protein [Terracidiphilus sp.]|jgi:hypothetical protein
MSKPSIQQLLGLDEQQPSGVSRRSFFKQAGMGATAAAAGVLLAPKASALVLGHDEPQAAAGPQAGLTTGDTNILIAAQIAEALAVTTYQHIIHQSPWFKRIPDDDQLYLQGAIQEEMSHYALEKSVTTQDTPYTEFFYPMNMFEDAQTTLNVLVSLEDAFIAAYLVGVRNFSTPDLRVTAARIMGIESDHRTLARALAGDVDPVDGGPITHITGLQGFNEVSSPPNNNGYERTQCWTKISQAVTALTPFVDETTAAYLGWDTSKSFKFTPFTPNLPSGHGQFFSFTGC